MASKSSKNFTGAKKIRSSRIAFFNFEGTAAAMQREIVEAHEQASRVWLARVKSEVDMWSELASMLAANRSPSEAFQAYARCVSQRVQMTAEDGQRLFSGYQKATENIAKSLMNGWPPAKHSKSANLLTN